MNIGREGRRKVEVNADDLWDGIAKRAKAYGIKELEDF